MNAQNLINKDNLERHLNPGPLAIIRDEDGVDLDPTLTHVKSLGFPNTLVLGGTVPEQDHTLFMKVDPSVETHDVINDMIDNLAGRWIYLGYNGEYLYFPFCEGRSISAAAQFVDEERRESVFCTTVDLYPQHFDRTAPALDPEDAHFDAMGYFSRDRFDGPHKLERQIDVFGGLKWRYAEHIEWPRQRIDRIAVFKAKTGLRLDERGLFNNPEMNTIACPWHHNMTFCIASFRVAKSLINNPGSAFEIESFMWDQSTRFEWNSQQMMSRGLMEPGQWF